MGTESTETRLARNEQRTDRNEREIQELSIKISVVMQQQAEIISDQRADRVRAEEAEKRHAENYEKLLQALHESTQEVKELRRDVAEELKEHRKEMAEEKEKMDRQQGAYKFAGWVASFILTLAAVGIAFWKAIFET